MTINTAKHDLRNRTLPPKSAALIIRFHYNVKDPRFEWRFRYFESTVLPKIEAQSYSEFDICVRCNPLHADRFRRLTPRILPFHVKNETVRYKRQGNKRYFYDFAPWSAVQGLKRYDVQLGLDSDDLISSSYVHKVMTLANLYQDTLHISFQPEIYRLASKKVESIGFRYDAQRGSAFMALSQPDKSNYRFIYERSHLTLGSLARYSILLPKGDCWATVHHINESTGTA